MTSFSGLRVMDLAWVVAGPHVGRVLADFGAEVIRVESRKRTDTARVIGPFPQGVFSVDDSGVFHNCNAGKLGLSLDLTHKDSLQVIRDLASKSDVLIESFSPGQMAKWGISYDSLKEINPRLIMISTSLMGQDGPYKSMAGFGSSGSSMAGFQSLSGFDNSRPLGPHGPYTDYLAPRIILASLFAALEHLRETGRGCYQDIAQTETGLIFQAPEIAHYGLKGEIPELRGNRSTSMVPHGVFPCGDGRWIAIAVRDDKDWLGLKALLPTGLVTELAPFDSFESRKANETFIENKLAEWTSAQNATELQAHIQESSVPAHVVSSSEDFCEDEQVRHLNHLVRLSGNDGLEMTVEGARYVLSRCKAKTSQLAPKVGQDNGAILKDILNYSAEEITRLEDSGVLS
ncbi:MAG: CaiB/BaiF CoA transferase family protein [Marinobacter sp.]